MNVLINIIASLILFLDQVNGINSDYALISSEIMSSKPLPYTATRNTHMDLRLLNPILSRKKNTTSNTSLNSSIIWRNLLELNIPPIRSYIRSIGCRRCYSTDIYGVCRFNISRCRGWSTDFS